jgi:hypothetical protein
VDTGELCSNARLGKSKRLDLENKLKKKMTGDMVEVVEYLPSKHKALCSNPSTLKKQNNEKIKIESRLNLHSFF